MRVRAAARLALAAAALLLHAQAAADAIGIIEAQPLLVPRLEQATHELTLHAHMFDGSRWKRPEIANAIADAARILGQCGVAVTAAELRVIDAPRAYRDYHTPESRRLLRAIHAPRPSVFFVEDTRQNPAYDAEAIGLANSRTRPELANTIWVAYGARDLPYAVAHELVHVLMNSGQHVDEPGNLMRDETAPGNDRLTARQCEAIKTRGEANGLLRRRR